MYVWSVVYVYLWCMCTVCLRRVYGIKYICVSMVCISGMYMTCVTCGMYGVCDHLVYVVCLPGVCDRCV